MKKLKNVPLPIIGESYKNRDVDVSNQQTINMYLEDNKGRVVLKSFPGAKEWLDIGVDSPIRALKSIGGNLYAVCGETLYWIDQNKTASSYSGTISGSEDVILETEGTNVVAVNSIEAFYGPLAGASLTKVSGLPQNTSSIAYIDKRIAYQQPDGVFYVSSQGDASTIDALDFAEAETFPDDILRLISRNRNLYPWGKVSAEQWYTSGSGRPPLDPTPNGSITYGLSGRMSISEIDDVFYFLDNRRKPRRLIGFERPQDLSDPARGKLFDGFQNVNNCQVIPITLDSENIILYSFPSDDRMLAFHEKTQSWSELKDGDSRYPINCYAEAFGKKLVGDFNNTGKIFELDFDTYTIDSRSLTRERTTANINASIFSEAAGPSYGGEIRINRLEIEMQTGVGGVSGDSRDPEVMVSLSEDGGQTFGVEQVLGLGQPSASSTRVEIRNLGQFQDCVIKVRVSDPVACVIRAMNADIDIVDA